MSVDLRRVDQPRMLESAGPDVDCCFASGNAAAEAPEEFVEEGGQASGVDAAAHATTSPAPGAALPLGAEPWPWDGHMPSPTVDVCAVRPLAAHPVLAPRGMAALSAATRRCRMEAALLRRAALLAGSVARARAAHEAAPAAHPGVARVSGGGVDAAGPTVLGAPGSRPWCPDGSCLLALRAGPRGDGAPAVGVLQRPAGTARDGAGGAAPDAGWAWQHLDTLHRGVPAASVLLGWVGGSARLLVFADACAGTARGGAGRERSGHATTDGAAGADDDAAGGAAPPLAMCAILYDRRQLARSHSLPGLPLALSACGTLLALAAPHPLEGGLWLARAAGRRSVQFASPASLAAAAGAAMGLDGADQACAGPMRPREVRFAPGAASLAFLADAGGCDSGPEAATAFVARVPRAWRDTGAGAVWGSPPARQLVALRLPEPPLALAYRAE